MAKDRGHLEELYQEAYSSGRCMEPTQKKLHKVNAIVPRAALTPAVNSETPLERGSRAQLSMPCRLLG